LTTTPLSPEIRATLDAGKALVLDAQARNDVASPGQAKVQATLNLARGTDLESQLLNPAMLQLAGAPSSLSPQGGISDMVSPLALTTPPGRARAGQRADSALAARGPCLIDEPPEPSSMTGLAAILAKKFPPAEGETPAGQQARYGRMFDYIRRRYHYAVLA